LKKNLLLGKDIYGHTVWYRAVEKGNLYALEVSWIWVKEVEVNTNEILLVENNKVETDFHIAIEKNNVNILEKMMFWGKEAQINQNELKKKLLLVKDNYGITV